MSPFDRAHTTSYSTLIETVRLSCVGFVAAAVSMPMGGCRARRPVVDDNSLVSAETVVVVMTAEPAVL